MIHFNFSCLTGNGFNASIRSVFGEKQIEVWYFFGKEKVAFYILLDNTRRCLFLVTEAILLLRSLNGLMHDGI